MERTTNFSKGTQLAVCLVFLFLFLPELMKENMRIQTIDLFVPPLSIQTLVENAIQHGILPLQEGGAHSNKLIFEIRIIFIFSNQKRLGLQKSQVFLG